MWRATEVSRATPLAASVSGRLCLGAKANERIELNAGAN